MLGFSNTQPQSVDSPPVSRVSPVHSPGTDPALHGPRRRAEPTESTCGEAANLHGESPLGAHARLPIMHALRPIALVAARCQPAPCSHLPPSTRSAGRYLRRHHARRHRSASCSLARTTLTGATLSATTLNGTHAWRHQARRLLARCGRAASALGLGAPRASSRQSDTHAFAGPSRHRHTSVGAPPCRSLYREQRTREPS